MGCGPVPMMHWTSLYRDLLPQHWSYPPPMYRHPPGPQTCSNLFNLDLSDHPSGCASFTEFLQNFSQCQIFWSLCLVVFLALTLKLIVQTSHSASPTLPVFFCVQVKNFSKTSTPLVWGIMFTVKFQFMFHHLHDQP